MAPKTPAARKKNVSASTPHGTLAAAGKNAAAEHQTVRPSLVSIPTDGYAKAQEDELEVLKAIYMEDFEEVEAKGAWSVRDSMLLTIIPVFLCLSSGSSSMS